MHTFNSPLEAFYYWEKKTPNNPFLNQYIDEKKFITYSYKEAGNQVRKFASLLQAYNLPEKSHIALISNNCAHWVLVDLAIMMVGHVSVPIYPNSNYKRINKILSHSDTKILIIGNAENVDIEEIKNENIPILSIEKPLDKTGKKPVNKTGKTWSDLMSENERIFKPYKQNKNDILTIAYTSGTTTSIKGVLHTVSNFTKASYSFLENVKKQSFKKIPKNLKYFSFSSLAVINEHVGITMLIISGGQIFFPRSHATMTANLIETQPDWFFGVPSVWLKLKEKILKNTSQKTHDTLLKTPALNTIYRNKIKQSIGLKNALFIFTGAANLRPETARWFKKIDVEILQGYGSTENCIISHANFAKSKKIGTVGRTLTGIETKILPDGEICIKHNHLFKGYYNDDTLTKNYFDSEGFFKTGDIGKLDDEGYLTITGRKKSIFKTTKGKFISPEYIESKLYENINIAYVCIVGNELAQPIALIKTTDIVKSKTKQQLAESMVKTIYILNHTLEKHEKIEKIVIIKDDWTPQNNLVTPTMKIKRVSIEKKYSPFYNDWFQHEDKVIFEN